MANEVKIEMTGDESDLVMALNKTDQSLDKLSSAVGKMKMSWTEFRSMTSTVMDALRIGQQVWQETIGQSLEYAEAIREISTISGMSATATSEFVQVLDDYKITTQDVLVATKALTKNGHAPSIETLAELSDEYLTLNTVEDKNKFILENLGKAGLQWVEVLEQGGDAILDMTNGVSKSLIVNQKQIDASRALEFQLDNLGDSAKGTSIAIGNYFTPALEALTHITNNATGGIGDFFNTLANNRTISIETSRLLKEQGFFTGGIVTATKEQVDAIRLQAIANIEAANTSTAATDAIETEEEAMARMAEEARIAAEALQEMTERNTDMLSLTMSISDEMKNYDEGLAELLEKYPEASDEVTAFKDAHSEAMTQIFVDLQLAKLAADGLTDAEYAMSLALLESTGALASGAVETGLAFDQIASAAENAGTVGMSALGGIIQSVMADGVIDAGELQTTLDTFNTMLPQEQVVGLQAVYEAAAASGVAGTDEVQSGMDAITTDKAVANIDALTAALYRIPSKVTVLVDYVTSGTPPPGIEMSQFGFRQL